MKIDDTKIHLTFSNDDIRIIEENPGVYLNTIVKYKNVNVYFDENGLMHRDDGPAIEPIDDGYFGMWCQHGKAHREDGPAITGIDSGIDIHCLNGRMFVNEETVHRVKAITSLDVDKQLYKVINGNDIDEYQIYSKNGKYHRPDKPAYVKYRNGKAIRIEWWYEGNRMNTVGGPIILEVDKNEWVNVEWNNRIKEPYIIYAQTLDNYYYLKYKTERPDHKLDGPISVLYDPISKKKIYPTYAIDGEIIHTTTGEDYDEYEVAFKIKSREYKLKHFLDETQN